MEMSKHIKYLLLTIATCTIVFLMFFFNLLSPYQDWDLSLKLIDDDKLLVLILFWVIISLVTRKPLFMSQCNDHKDYIY